MLNSLPQLSDEQLRELSQQTALAQARKRAPSLSQAETELYRKIYNVKIPEHIHTTIRQLTAKQRTVGLGAEEQAKLTEAVDEVEIRNAERISYLVQLGLLQGVELEKLIQEIDLAPFTYE